MSADMKVRLGVTFHHIFYAPYLVAVAREEFARQGLEVESTTAGHGQLLIDAMQRGELDIGLGGVMRSMIAYDKEEPFIPIHFARLNNGDGFFLVGRQPVPEFDLEQLLGRRLITFTEAPTPWYVLRGLLKERGLDPDEIETIESLPAAEAAARFEAGEGDFIQCPGQIAEALVMSGAGQVVAEMAIEAGEIPYSSYSASREFLEREPDAVRAFARAHSAALAWLRAASAADVWSTLQTFFPDADPEVYQRAIARYQRLGVWSADASLPRPGYDRLGQLLRLGGLLTHLAPYDTVVDDRLTREAIGLSSEAASN
jgi:NitT/TauT family transport system substrate-binding protein